MKRLCFLSFKGFIFAISLLNVNFQLFGMESYAGPSSEQKQIARDQYIAQCCETYDRYMKIEFFEMQFIKDVLSRIHEDINGLELQELYLQNDRCLSRVDKDSLLKSIKSKIVKKYRECDALWAAHERHQMNLLTFDELSQLQEFVRERDSYKHEPDVNQQIFAQLDPVHLARSSLEYRILEELHNLAQNDHKWLQHMAHIGSKRVEKKRSDVWRSIQWPKQLLLGKIFSAAVDGCPVAQVFVRHYHFDFVLAPEHTSILPLQLLPEPALPQPAPSTSSSTHVLLTENKSKLNPDAPAFIPSFIRLSSEPKKTVEVSEALAHTEVLGRQDSPAQQDLQQPRAVDTQSLSPADKQPAVKKQEPVKSVEKKKEKIKTETHPLLQSTSPAPQELESSSVVLRSVPDKPVATPEVLVSKVVAAQQPQDKQVVQKHAKKPERKKEKAPEKQAPIRQESVKMVEHRKEEVKPEAESSLQPAPQVSKQEVHEQPSQVDNNAFIARCYRDGKHDEAIAFIEKLGNKHLLSWYRGVCLLQSQARGDIKNAIDLLEPLFLLIPGRKHFDKRELVGFDDVIRALSQNLDNKFVKAFLIRLLLAVGISPKKALIQNFVREASSIADPSIQVLIFYIHDKEIIPQSGSAMQIVYHLIEALEDSSLRQNIREEVIYFLQKIGQSLFDVNFQTIPHNQASYPKDDINTRCAISACYALVPALLPSDPLKAACMFIAAENTVAFLHKVLQAENRENAAKTLAYLPAGITALHALQNFIKRQKNIDVLSALIFSYSRRYISIICHSDLSVDLASISRQFLADAKQYLVSEDRTNTQRSLLVSIACNAYSILGCKLGIKRGILIELMRGVVAVSPEQYWFFRYNLESLVAGSQDESVAVLNPYRPQLSSVRKDALISSMIISGLTKESSWWCSIL
ncbi:MAG: hypothetical protein WC192_02230 [Candidatus Babeliales bacterium]|jgi:hypothetical protein